MSCVIADHRKPAPHADTSVLTPVHHALQKYLDTSLVLSEEWESLPGTSRKEVLESVSVSSLLASLLRHGLLTEYQKDRIEAGTTHGLLLGNYRVLDRLGAGAMGIVFKAEHCRMRRIVAVKVLPLHSGQDRKHLLRFLSEMRAVAQLQHPNIVSAIDAGELAGKDADAPVLHYFAMEYVPGQDLERYINDRGPLPVTKACDLVYQIASALAEAHKHNLVHRDIKPSNVLITPDEQAKLLDFGLARHFRHRLHRTGRDSWGPSTTCRPNRRKTRRPWTFAPTSTRSAGRLFWSLTGRPPFPGCGDARAGGHPAFATTTADDPQRSPRHPRGTGNGACPHDGAQAGRSLRHPPRP